MIIATITISLSANAQNRDDFWGNVRFGGSLGAGFGNNYTQVLVAPGALYPINEYVAAGVGLQYSFAQQEDVYKSSMYGGSVIGIFSPLPEIQLSAELEQLRVNLDYDQNYLDAYNINMAQNKRDFWNTAIFFGVGYSTGNVTFGLRYNILFRERDYVYTDALMPFMRVYF